MISVNTRKFFAHLLPQDTSGTTVVEFAFVAPVLFVMLMGTLDLGHQLYTRAILNGEVHKAGRDSALETGIANGAALDAKVEGAVHKIASNATVTFTRNSFRNFSEAAAKNPEDFTDNNDNGTCDAGEPYEDANNNDTWDDDGGDDSQGGAKDAVVYTVSATYPRLFPMAGLAGLPDTITITATTVLRNQPFADQDESAATPGNCT